MALSVDIGSESVIFMFIYTSFAAVPPIMAASVIRLKLRTAGGLGFAAVPP